MEGEGSLSESSWMQDSFLPAGWLMLLDQGREATSWRSPDGRVLASRPLAMKHLLGQTPVAPGGQMEPVPAAVLARGRQGLEEEGWREAGHLPQGWLQKARDDSHHSYLTQNYDTLKSVKTAVSYMKMKGYSYLEVEKFWQTAPLPSSGRSKEQRVEWQGQQSQEGGSTWRRGRRDPVRSQVDDFMPWEHGMKAENIKTKNMRKNPNMGRVAGNSENNYDKILVNYDNGSVKSISALDEEAKEQRKNHEMKRMEQYLKTVPSKNVMEEEDTSENLTEPEDNDEVNEEDKRFMLDERDTSEDLTDDEEDSKPKISQEVSIKLPEDDGGDTSDDLTGDEDDSEPKILEEYILKSHGDDKERTSDKIAANEEDFKPQNTKDGFSETLADDHKDDPAKDEKAYNNKNKEPVSEDDVDEASTDEDSSSDDEDIPVAKKEDVDVAPPSPPPRPSSPSCGSCSGCLMEDDCGCCRVCADSPQFGGEGRMRGQRCATRRCTDQGMGARRVTREEMLREKERVERAREEEQLAAITVEEVYSLREEVEGKGLAAVVNKRKYIRQGGEVPVGKRYSCDQCDWEGGATGLNYHTKSIHLGITYDCKACDFKSARSVYLVQHTLSKHYDDRTNMIKETATTDIEDTELFAIVRKQVEQEVKEMKKIMEPKLKRLDKKYGTEKERWPQRQSPIKLSEDGSVECKECGWRGTSGNGLRYHRLSKHEGLKGGKYRCEYCDFISSSKFYLKNHLDNNHSNPESRVPFVRKNKDILEPHGNQGNGYEGSRNKNMTVKMPKSCDQCEWSGNSQAGLWYHKKSKHQKVFFDCHYCDYKSSRSSVLEEHMMKHHSQKMIRPSEVEIRAEVPIVKNEILGEETTKEESMVEAMDVEKDEDAELPPLWREEGGVLIFSPPGVEGRHFPSRREAVVWLVASGGARPEHIYTLWAGLGREGWSTDPLLPPGWLRQGWVYLSPLMEEVVGSASLLETFLQGEYSGEDTARVMELLEREEAEKAQK